MEAVGEEEKDAFKKKSADALKCVEDMKVAISAKLGRINFVKMDTSCSEQTTLSTLSSSFKPRVMIVNHEKRLGIDTTCSNLALKYNMIYISAYQLIKNHITNGTEWGQKLTACQKNKDIALTT